MSTLALCGQILSTVRHADLFMPPEKSEENKKMVTNKQTTDSGILYVNQTMLQASKILNLCVKDNM